MPKNKGFTLIELMIVVAVIGILAAVAVPKFAEMIRRSKDGAAKGSLGAVRSALTIYYSDMEGFWPLNVDSLAVGKKYLKEVPAIQVAGHSASAVVDDNDDWGTGGTMTADPGRFIYWNYPWGAYGRSQGDIFIGCTHGDAKGIPWSQQ